MSRKTDALKRALVALGHGSAVTDYSGETVADVLKELAVILGCGSSAAEIRATKISGVLDFIADNYGDESKEPYKLTIIGNNNADATFKLNGKNVNAGVYDDKLYNGDKIKITAEGKTGYDAAITVNGEAFTSGDTFVVDGAAVSITISATLKTYDLARTADEHVTVAVTKGGNAVEDGEGVLTHGNTITVTATAAEGYTLKSLKLNGTDFTSGNTHTVAGDVSIVAESEATGG